MTRRPQKKKAARKPARKPKPDALDDLISASAAALGLTIGRAWMPEVRHQLQVTLAHGAKVASVALPDDAEPAPVFEA
jgi:type II secretory pathway component PulM